MTTYAKRVEGIVVREVHNIEGERWLVTDCISFEEYKALPNVVLFEGQNHSKQGWNSDTGKCGYVNRNGSLAIALR